MNWNSTDSAWSANGTDSSITYTKTLYPQSARFSWSWYITVNGVITSMASATTGTINFWCTQDSDTNSDDTMLAVTKWNANQVSDFVISTDWRAWGPNNLYLSMRIDSTNQWQWSTWGNGADFLLSWYHMITITHNWTTPTIYFDWRDVTTAWSNSFTTTTDKTKWFKAIITDATNTANEVDIWAWNNNSSVIQHITWNIDELVFDDAAWSAAEVANHYAYKKGYFM